MEDKTEIKADPREYIEGGRRCSLVKSDNLPEWWYGESPRNGYGAMVEGDWDDWLYLATGILNADREWRQQQGELSAIDMIAAERFRQIERKGYSAKHDDEHDQGELAGAAAWYAISAIGLACGKDPDYVEECAHAVILYPFEEGPKKQLDPIQSLIKAGALIVAEIERLQRQKQEESDGEPSPTKRD